MAESECCRLVVQAAIRELPKTDKEGAERLRDAVGAAPWSADARDALDPLLTKVRNGVTLLGAEWVDPWGAYGEAGRAPSAHDGSGLPQDARELASLLAGRRPQDTALAQEVASMEAKLGLSSTEGLTPFRMATLMRRSRVSREDAIKLGSLAAKVRVIHGFGDSLPGVRSGLNAWAAFCDSRGQMHFPVTAGAAADFSSWNRNPATYGIYLAHVRKACILLGLATEWYDEPLVKAAKAGLKKLAPKRAPQRPNISARVCQAIAHTAVLCEEMIFVIIAWVFLLRARAEGALLRRVDAGACPRVLPDRDSATIGLTPDGKSVAIALGRRKNKPEGDLVVRDCSCGGASAGQSTAQHCGVMLCPVHVIWPEVVKVTPPGHHLFRVGVADRAADWMRTQLGSLRVDHASSFGLHDLRRGGAQALVASGARLGTILRAGSWSSKAFIVYLDSEAVERSAMGAVLTNVGSLDSGDEDP